jgi:pimeloyl-ACP methyl ester carboxylesterase
MPTDVETYAPRRASTSRTVAVRGLAHHVLEWPAAGGGDPERPPLVLAHGWMDVGASFQFVVDALPDDRRCIAFDWRGFGGSATPQADTYFFPEYLGDLEALLDALVGRDGRVDLLGHSMGANVAMLYCGVRPERVRRFVNLEGFGTPRAVPAQAPRRFAGWLDSLRDGERLKDYDSLDAVAARLVKTNPLLRPDRARWVAGHWSEPTGDGPRRRLLADPNHKRNAPVAPNVDEWLAVWQRIVAPVLFVEGDRTDLSVWWGERYGKPEFEQRLATLRAPLERHVVSPAGHMLHHDRPEDVARHVEAFLAKPDAAFAPVRAA